MSTGAGDGAVTPLLDREGAGRLTAEFPRDAAAGSRPPLVRAELSYTSGVVQFGDRSVEVAGATALETRNAAMKVVRDLAAAQGAALQVAVRDPAGTHELAVSPSGMVDVVQSAPADPGAAPAGVQLPGEGTGAVDDRGGRSPANLGTGLPVPSLGRLLAEGRAYDRRMRRRRRMVALAGTLVVAIGSTAGVLVVVDRQHSLDERARAEFVVEQSTITGLARDLASALDEATSTATDVGDQVTPDGDVDGLREAIGAARAALNASESYDGSPRVQVADARDRAAVLRSALRDLRAGVNRVVKSHQTWVVTAAHDAWLAARDDADAAAAAARKVLETSAGRVGDEAARTALDGQVSALEALASEQVTPSAARWDAQAAELSARTSALVNATQGVREATTTVESAVATWEKAQADAAAAAAAQKPAASAAGTSAKPSAGGQTPAKGSGQVVPAGAQVTSVQVDSATSGVGSLAFVVTVTTSGPSVVTVRASAGDQSSTLASGVTVNGSQTFTGTVDGLAAGQVSFSVSAGGLSATGEAKVF